MTNTTPNNPAQNDEDHFYDAGQFFGVMPKPAANLFRDENITPRTEEETARLQEAIEKRKPFAELPIDIISLFYEQEAEDYMEDTHEFLWQAVSKKEKFLHRWSDDLQKTQQQQQQQLAATATAAAAAAVSNSDNGSSNSTVVLSEDVGFYSNNSKKQQTQCQQLQNISKL